MNVIAEGERVDSYDDPDWDEEPEVNGYMHALVTQVSASAANVRFGQRTATIAAADMAWAKRKLALTCFTLETSFTSKCWRLIGDGKARVSLEQDSGAEGALVAIDNAIR